MTHCQHEMLIMFLCGFMVGAGICVILMMLSFMFGRSR